MPGELEAIRREAAQNHDKYLRALAESENMRKRLERLCDDRLWQEKKRLLQHFLELADQLEDALKYASGNTPLEQGVRLTYQQLLKTLDQEGVKPLRSVGEVFDPSVHEAVELGESAGRENTVTEEYRKGYTLDGRLLRAARVQVASSRPKQTPEES